MKYQLTSFALISYLLVRPTAALAQGNDGFAGRLIICNTDVESVRADSANRCDFNDLIQVGNLLIDLLFQLSLAIAVLVTLVIGFKYLTAGSSDKKKDAKESFKKLAIGFALILGAYLIVNTIFIIAGVNTDFRLLAD